MFDVAYSMSERLFFNFKTIFHFPKGLFVSLDDDVFFGDDWYKPIIFSRDNSKKSIFLLLTVF